MRATDTLQATDTVYAKTGERHYKTDGAESALRSRFIDHSLLHERERTVDGIDAFDSDDVFAGGVCERH